MTPFWSLWKDGPWHYLRIPPVWLLEATPLAYLRRDFQRSIGASPIFQTDSIQNEVTGLLGEKAAASLFSVKVDIELRSGGDGGVDLRVGPLHIDVKTCHLRTIPRPDNKLVMPLPQFRKLKDGLVLLAMAYVPSQERIWCVGWEGSVEFKQKAQEWKDAPACPCRCLPFSDLRPLEELNDLITHLMVEAVP